jgi:hypothetical protein
MMAITLLKPHTFGINHQHEFVLTPDEKES